MTASTFANEAEESAYAKRMLERADKTLALIDEAFIVKERGHNFRAMPTFRHEEISLGATLGTGGFGIVNEISKFTLDEEVLSKNEEENGEKEKENGEKENGEKEKVVGQHVKSNIDGLVVSNGQDKKSTTGATVVSPTATSDTTIEGNEAKDDAAAAASDDAAAALESSQQQASNNNANDDDLMFNHDDEFHYDVEKARELMTSRVTKNGYARYALKRLHNDLTELERARGMVDLAVEAKYLSLVWHPNISTYYIISWIFCCCLDSYSFCTCEKSLFSPHTCRLPLVADFTVKMRGMCSGPLVSDEFFIILDRLVETLDKRMHTWHLQHQTLHKWTRIFCFKKKQTAIANLMVERMMVAYDLAAAFFYLHENRCVLILLCVFVFLLFVCRLTWLLSKRQSFLFLPSLAVVNVTISLAQIQSKTKNQSTWTRHNAISPQTESSIGASILCCCCGGRGRRYVVVVVSRVS